MKSSVSIIYNPAARKASDASIDHAVTFFEREGYADEVINGMVWSDVPVALLPMGTTNVLAKELNLPEDLYGALRAAVHGSPKKVSLGRIETGGGPPRFFCLMAGVGLDGKAVYDVNQSIKKISGGAAYILSGIKNIAEFSPARIVLQVDGREYAGYTAVVGKASKYGGNFKVTPDADLMDPFLYACIFLGRGRLDLLRYSMGVLLGTHLRYRDVVYLKASRIDIQGRAHIQVDGDYLGLSPARISVAESAVNLIF
jgi:diacylglycerol kinase (ATP)